jgi:hypothetical protein
VIEVRGGLIHRIAQELMTRGQSVGHFSVEDHPAARARPSFKDSDRSVRPTRATTSLAASVDHTEARNDPVLDTA